MTTLILFDYDGVLNPIPYEKEWVGSSDTDISSFAAIDPRNWKVVEYPIDNEVYFTPDKTAVVSLPGYYEDREITVRWSTELIDKVNTLNQRDSVEAKWLTAWRENATALLNPLLGIDPAWESMEWAHRMSDYSQWGKLEAIENQVAQGDHRPLVWIDDVAIKNAHHYATKPPEDGRADRRSPFVTHGIDTLFVETSTYFGISRAQWADIEHFVMEHEGS